MVKATASFKEDEMIMDVEATVLENDLIRLKYLAIAGACGPSLTMPISLAEKTVEAIQKAIKTR